MSDAVNYFLLGTLFGAMVASALMSWWMVSSLFALDDEFKARARAAGVCL